MTKTEVMNELRDSGSAQTRKTYRRHGVEGETFGVSYAVLGRLKAEIKTDQALACELWSTGNHDARVLATMIADPQSMTAAELNAWALDLDNRHLAGAFSNVAAEAPSARKLMEKWTSARNEFVACAGWHTLASLARQENDLSDSYFKKFLKKIESRIHGSANWVRHAMNNALINVGIRNPKLEKLAIASAQRIGTVEVDHGETGCKTPEAVAYIEKTVAYNKKQAAKKPQQSD